MSDNTLKYMQIFVANAPLGRVMLLTSDGGAARQMPGTGAGGGA
jgi:hypothetical protein